MANTKEILIGIESILEEEGKFVPDIDWDRIRDKNKKFQRIKEGIFKKQVVAIWNTHGVRLRKQYYENEYERPGTGVNEMLQNTYNKSPKPKRPIMNGAPSSIDRKRKDDRANWTGKDSDGDQGDDVDHDIRTKIKRRKKMITEKFAADVPSVTYDDVGGLDETKEQLVRQMIHLIHPNIYGTLGVKPPTGILLFGAPGSGKTLLAKASVGQLGLKLINVSTPELISGVSGGSEKNIRELFDTAQEYSPCVIFLDELDAICSSREDSSKEMTARVIAQLLSSMDNMTTSDILLIGATSRPEVLDSSLRRAGRFDREISIGIPSERERRAILKVTCGDLKLSDDFDLAMLARITPGYVAADIDALAREAAQEALDRISTVCTTTEPTEPWQKWTNLELDQEKLNDISITFADLQRALKRVVPSAKREGFATVPDVTWESIGALENIRSELSLSILAPIRNPIQFERLGLARPSGILLTGPPGCGKTLLAKAIANESGLNFISVKGPELLNMYVGESERAVRSVFARARSSKPCVIFFDEIDALAPRRQSGSQTGATRVVNQLLTELDGLEERKSVYIIAATNRYEIIDPAILRPGRLDKTLYVGLPDNEDIKKIITKITKNGTKPPFGKDIDLDTIVNSCVNFSGADVAALIREAALLAARDLLTASEHRMEEDVGQQEDIYLTMEHFTAALTRVKSSVSDKDRLYYEKMNDRLNK